MVGAFLTFTLSAQICEFFTDYQAGQKLAYQAQDMGRDYWTTFSGAINGAEDGVVDEMDGKQCVHFTYGNDQVLKLGQQSAGKWILNFNIFVPAGKIAYYNVIADFVGNGSDDIWAFQVYFNKAGSAPGVGTMDAGGVGDAKSFNFTHDTWFSVKNIMDLDNDTAFLYINDELIHSWKYSLGTFPAQPCPKVIDVFDLFPPTAGTSSEFYVTDVSFGRQCNFDEATNGDYVAQYYSDFWMTWENQSGTSQDAVISNEQAESTPNSAKLTFQANGTGTDLVHPMFQTKGVHTIDFDMYIPNNAPAYFNLLHQHSPTGNPTQDWWAVGVYFNVTAAGQGGPYDGTYIVQNDQVINFTAPNNQWFPVSIYVDIDNDIARISINGEQLHEWQFSLCEGAGLTPNKQLAANDFYPPEAGSVYYIDNYAFDVPRGIKEIQSEPIFNFDDVSNNSYVAQSYPDWWTTWSNDPGSDEDALISNEQSSSAPQSAKCTDGTDLIFKAGDKISGDYTISFELFIPDDVPAYFNVLQIVDGDDSQWAFDCFFNMKSNPYGLPLGTYLIVADEEIFFDLPGLNEWIKIAVYIDLDEDYATIYINGKQIYEWQYSIDVEGNPGTLQLAGVDFWPPTANSVYYIDNFYYYPGLVIEEKYPVMNVTPASIDETVVEGATTAITVPITINNTGEADGEYEAKAVVGEEDWLSIEGDTQGIVAPADNKSFDAIIDPTELEKGEYEAVILVTTNDPDHETIEIPCKLTVDTDGIIDFTINGVQTKLFPNPASDIVNIECNRLINSIELINYMGQVVYSAQVNAENTTITTANLSAGIYFVKVSTEVGANSVKLIVK